MDKPSPHRASNKSGGKKPAEKDKKRTNRNTVKIVTIIAMIEGFSLVLWIESEDFGPQPAHFLRSLSICGFLAGIAYLSHKLTSGKFKKPVIALIWLAWVGLCFVLFGIKLEQPKPHVTLSVQIGDSPSARIVLTNQYLESASEVNVITNLPNGTRIFNGVPVGFIIVPMRPGDSNTVFHLVAKNDSTMELDSLQLGVAFPKGWKMGVDSEKWHEAEMNLFDGEYELPLTNAQGMVAMWPNVLYPGDWVNFPPITNFDSPIWHDKSNRISSIRLIAKTPGFREVMAVNVVFIPSPSNFSKPFLIPAALSTNGLHLLISTNELFKKIEDLSK